MTAQERNIYIKQCINPDWTDYNQVEIFVTCYFSQSHYNNYCAKFGLESLQGEVCINVKAIVEYLMNRADETERFNLVNEIMLSRL